MTSFDATYTDAEFQQAIVQADNDWMEQHARREPDLEVEGLKPGLLSRLFGLFGPKAV